MKKKWLSIFSLGCASILCASMVGCTNDNVYIDENENATAETYVSLNINPAIEITLNKNDKVLSVYGANEDGQVLLYGESEALIGLDVETAVEEITELAEELGYFDENSVVNATVTGEDTQKSQDIFDKIDAKITAKGNALGLSLIVDKDQVFSVMREYKDFLETNNLTEEDLPIQKYKLAVSASETGEVTLEVAVEMEIDELLEVVKEAHKQMKDFATREYQKIKEEKLAEFENVVNRAIEQEYLEYFISKFDFTSAYRSVEYAVYSTIADGLNIVATHIDYASNVRFIELPESAVEQVMTALNIEDRALIENHDGKVTVGSIERYADRVLKNIADEQTALELESVIDQALSEVELVMQQEINSEIEKHLPQIQQIIASANQMLNGIDQNISTLLAQVKQDVAQLESDLNALVEQGITADSLRTLAKEMKAKAEQVLEQLEPAIEQAGAELKAKVENAKGEFDGHKNTMMGEINRIEQDAKEHLNNLKNDFRGHN